MEAQFDWLSVMCCELSNKRPPRMEENQGMGMEAFRLEVILQIVCQWRV